MHSVTIKDRCIHSYTSGSGEETVWELVTASVDGKAWQIVEFVLSWSIGNVGWFNSLWSVGDAPRKFTMFTNVQIYTQTQNVYWHFGKVNFQCPFTNTHTHTHTHARTHTRTHTHTRKLAIDQTKAEFYISKLIINNALITCLNVQWMRFFYWMILLNILLFSIDVFSV